VNGRVQGRCDAIGNVARKLPGIADDPAEDDVEEDDQPNAIEDEKHEAQGAYSLRDLGGGRLQDLRRTLKGGVLALVEHGLDNLHGAVGADNGG